MTAGPSASTVAPGELATGFCAQIAQAIERFGFMESSPSGRTAKSSADTRTSKRSRLGREERGVILEIQEDGENALSLGFTPNELSRILEEPGDLEVREIETGPVWISVRGPLAQQANALKALEQAMTVRRR